MNLKTILIILAAGLSSFLANYMAASVNLALKTIGLELTANPAELSLVPSVYLLGTSLFLIPLGKISDAYGAKRILLGGCGFFVLVSIMISFFAQDFISLLVFRGLQGVAAAFVHVSHIPIVISNVPKEYRATSLGILSALAFFGSTTGNFLGGLITEFWGWRSIFSSAAIGGFLAFIIVFFAVHSEKKGKDAVHQSVLATFDFRGMVIYAAALILLQVGAQNLDNKFSFFILLLAVLALAAFVRRQGTLDNPIYDVKLFKTNKIFAISNVCVFFSFLGTYGCSYLAALYLQLNRGLSPLEAGAVLFIQPGIQIVFAPLGGFLADKTTPLFIATLGMSLVSVGYIILSCLTTDTAFMLVYAALMFVGIGVSFFASPNTTILMSSISESKKGLASASLSVMRNFGMQFSMIFCGAMFMISLGDIKGISPESYGQMLTVIRACYMVFATTAISTVFLLLLSRRYKR